MADTIQNAVTKLMTGHPIGSQDGTSNPVIYVRLLDAFGDAAWWLAEYDPETNCAYGFVTWLYLDDWDYFVLDCLADFVAFDAIPRVVVDDDFEPMTFLSCWIKHEELFRKEFPG